MLDSQVDFDVIVDTHAGRGAYPLCANADFQEYVTPSDRPDDMFARDSASPEDCLVPILGAYQQALAEAESICGSGSYPGSPMIEALSLLDHMQAGAHRRSRERSDVAMHILPRSTGCLASLVAADACIPSAFHFCRCPECLVASAAHLAYQGCAVFRLDALPKCASLTTPANADARKRCLLMVDIHAGVSGALEDTMKTIYASRTGGPERATAAFTFTVEQGDGFQLAPALLSRGVQHVRASSRPGAHSLHLAIHHCQGCPSASRRDAARSSHVLQVPTAESSGSCLASPGASE